MFVNAAQMVLATLGAILSVTPARRFGFKSNSKFRWTSCLGAEDRYRTSFEYYCCYRCHIFIVIFIHFRRE